MGTIYVVDTHALVWFVEANPRLSGTARAALENAANRLILPAIALAEACFIVERGRTTIPSVDMLTTALESTSRFEVYPLDREVVILANRLTSIDEMHDRQIVATALLLQNRGETVQLVSHDGNITRSGLVPVLW